MDRELHAAIRKNILDAETQFNECMEHIEGLEKAERTLNKIERLRDEQLREGHDTRMLTELFEESKAHFDKMVQKSLDCTSFTFDFAQWADEIDSDLRSRGPSLLSLPTNIGVFEPAPIGQVTTHRSGPPSVKSFIHILQSNGRLDLDTAAIPNTKKERKTFLWATYVAWTFAVIGMIFALGFLTRDFYTARTNFAIHIERNNVSFPHPAVTVCSHIPRLPFFSDFPTRKYPGVPLYGVSLLMMKSSTGNGSRKFSFPDTIPRQGGIFEEVISGPHPDACPDMKKQISLNNTQASLFKLSDFFDSQNLEYKQCYWCVRVGASKKIIASANVRQGPDLSASSYQLNFFRSQFTTGCTTKSGLRDKFVRRMLANQLRIHAKALIERGMLDFGDYPPDNKQYDALLPVQFGFNHNQKAGGGDYIAGMVFACNVYFFTGYFYPTEGEHDIRYRFEVSNKSWVPIGRGPYYKIRNWAPDARDLIGPGHAGVEQDLYTTSNSYVLFQDPDALPNSTFVPLNNKVWHIESGTALFLDLKRLNMRGKIKYQVRTKQLEMLETETLAVSGFSVTIRSLSRVTEDISSVSTIGWSQYVTDVFEFIGLFTGVCVFTLLVAPAHSLVTSELTKKDG